MTFWVGNTAIGTNGNDHYVTATGPVSGNGASNVVLALAGHDVAYGGGGNDTVFGAAGDDILMGDGGNDTLYGGEGNDRLEGGTGSNKLFGEAGNDSFFNDPSGGADSMYGGSGHDIAYYSYQSWGVNVNVAAGTASGDLISGIEEFHGSSVTDVMSGDYGSNWFYGEGGGDVLYGGNGNDTLDGGAGADQLFGGSGVDKLVGGLDNDVLVGGQGADSLDGGLGVDTVSYATSSASVYVDLASAYAYGGDAAYDHIGSIENLVGSAHGDVLFGNAAANRIEGGAGDDVIGGRAGADSMIGGSGEDMLDYTGSTAGVKVYLTTGYASGGHATGDKFSGFESLFGSSHGDELRGTNGANELWGSGGADKLVGYAGEDYLVGGAGKDTIDGGSGDDQIVYFDTADSGPGASAWDLLVNFVKGEDEIDLSAIDARLHTGGAQDFVFKGQQNFTAEGQVRYYKDDGFTFIEVNNDGSQGADMVIQLSGEISLSSNDFTF